MGDSEMSTGASHEQGGNPIDPKGKGKAIDAQPHDTSMDEDDDDDDDEEEEVRLPPPPPPTKKPTPHPKTQPNGAPP